MTWSWTAVGTTRKKQANEYVGREIMTGKQGSSSERSNGKFPSKICSSMNEVALVESKPGYTSVYQERRTPRVYSTVSSHQTRIVCTESRASPKLPYKVRNNESHNLPVSLGRLDLLLLEFTQVVNGQCLYCLLFHLCLGRKLQLERFLRYKVVSA
jgi:hypothetical protein